MHCLVGVLAQAALDNGVHIERLDLTRVFADQVTRLVPQLIVAFLKRDSRYSKRKWRAFKHRSKEKRKYHSRLHDDN